MFEACCNALGRDVPVEIAAEEMQRLRQIGITSRILLVPLCIAIASANPHMTMIELIERRACNALNAVSPMKLHQYLGTMIENLSDHVALQGLHDQFIST
jgi:hypothetical protein